MVPTEESRACLVYVSSTAAMREIARQKLSDAGYVVCEVEAALADAAAAQVGESSLPPELEDCIRNSQVCVFLLPENLAEDAGIANAASYADAKGKPIICVVAGARIDYPQVFDDNAESLIRSESPRLADAIGGEPVWEGPDGKRSPSREIKRVRCQ